MKDMKSSVISKSFLVSLGGVMAMNGFARTEKGISQQPNIVFIFADDMGYGDVSALNENSKLNTVNIDRIANEGVISSVSTPSRYSLLTGRYNWRSDMKYGVLGGYSKSLIRQDRRTIANVLRDKGYTTACIGKWHLGWNWNNIEAGYYEAGNRRTDNTWFRLFLWYFRFAGYDSVCVFGK